MACLEVPIPLPDRKLKSLCSAQGEIICPCPPGDRSNIPLQKGFHSLGKVFQD